MAERPDPRTSSGDSQPLLPDDLVTVYAGEDDHLYIAHGDGRRSTRLTWSPDDFSVIQGMPAMPGVTGELEDGNVFSHPTPSPDGRMIATFGLLPTMSDQEAAFDGPPWEAVEDDFPYLAEAPDWVKEEPPAAEPDDVAGGGMVIAMVGEEEGDESVLLDVGAEIEGLGPEERAEAESALMAELAREAEEEEEEMAEDEDEGDGEPRFWPGGRVYVIHTDGVRLWEPFELEDGSPTHLDWAPDGRHLLVLHREDDQLRLNLVDALQPGDPVELLRGEPIFWSWQPRGRLLALRVGREGGPVVCLADPLRDPLAGSRVIGRAGAFYAPAWHPNGRSVAFAQPAGGVDFLVRYRIPDGDGQILCALNGRAAFGWSPTGRRLAVAVAPEGHGAFASLDLIDSRGRGRRTIWGEPFIAFSWLPGGDGLLVCGADPERGLLEWLAIDVDGNASPVGRPFLPTRECVVALHFFEQVAASHPFLSADGLHVVSCGLPVDDDEVPGSHEHGGLLPDGREAPRVLVAPIRGDGLQVAVGTGSFACFARSG